MARLNYNRFDGAPQFLSPPIKEKQARTSPTKYTVGVGGGVKTFQFSGGSSSHFGTASLSNRHFSATNKAPGRPGTATDYEARGGGGVLSRQMGASRPSTTQPRGKKMQGRSPRKANFKERPGTTQMFGTHKIKSDEPVSDIHVSVVANRYYNNPLANSNY